MKKIAAVLIVLSVLLSIAGCGKSPTPVTPPAQSADALDIPMELSDEESVFHGMHIRIPAVLEMQAVENDIEQYYSVFSESYSINARDYMSYYLNFEADDESLTGSYSPESARIYFAEGDFESRLSDDFRFERKRINGIDVIIRELTESDGGVEKTVDVMLNSGCVELSFVSYSDAFYELFDQSIESIWVEDSEIPDIVKATEPEALEAAGLSEEVWETNGIYLNIPIQRYVPIVYDSGTEAFVATSGSYFMLVDTTSEPIYEMGEAEWASMITAVNAGFHEITDFAAGVYHGMNAAEADFTFLSDSGEEFLGIWMVLQPWTYAEECVLIMASYPVGDTEAEEYLTDMLSTARVADGWVGAGIMDLHFYTLDELNEMAHGESSESSESGFGKN